MPSRAEVEQFAQANRDLRKLVLADLVAFWRHLDPQEADVTRDALLRFVPLLVAQYGEVAAAIAADFYDNARETSRVVGRFTATVADPVDEETVLSRVRWSVGPLYGKSDPAAALGRLEQHVDELTLRPGRDTIARNTGRDPAGPRWARVPVGKTCAFCLVAASRGAVYRSEESASRHFHGQCDCTATPFWPKDPYPEGYNPDALLQQYQDARAAADSGRLKPILSELRSQTDGH